MKRWSIGVGLVSALLLVGCSSSDDASRRVDVATVMAEAPASTTGTPSEKEFCDQASENYTPVCFQLIDEAERFTAPYVTDANLDMTVTRWCAGSVVTSLGGYTCSDGWGSMVVGSTSTWCPETPCGRLTPNPFDEVGRMVFHAASKASGTAVRLHIAPIGAPFDGPNEEAQAYFSLPRGTSTYAGGKCSNGEYISCEILGYSYATSGWEAHPKFVLRDRPVIVRIQNSDAKVQLKQVSSPVLTDVLLDVRGQTPNAVLLPPQQSAAFGGYRSLQADASLQFDYVIVDSAGSSESSASCAGCGSPVRITVRISKDISSKPDAGSKCEVTNISSRATYSCRNLQVVGSVDGTIYATVEFTSGSGS